MPLTQTAPATTGSKLAARGLELYYGQKRALHGITLEMPAQKVTALIGPSGCGKSTFLRCFNRMNDLIPDVRIQGSATLDGSDIYGRHVDVVELRRRVGMVFQKSNPFPKTIFDNVAFGPRIQGEKDAVRLDAIVEKSLRSSALWDEVKEVGS